MKYMLLFALILFVDCLSQVEELKPNELTAYLEKDSLVRELFKTRHLNYPPECLFVRIFKDEKILEVWAKNLNEEKYQLVKNYPVCYVPGKLGPKRKEGDKQVPEGFYFINDINPFSSFFLSLGINYPNKSDKILTTNTQHPGGDIYIHGECVSTGCIPLEDDIKEVYLMALLCKRKTGNVIPIHIFPFHFENNEKFISSQSENKNLFDFWKQLEKGYSIFNNKKTIPEINIDDNGNYIF